MRLKHLRNNQENIKYTKFMDVHNLLPDIQEDVVINSIDDIMNDDFLDLITDYDEGLFKFNHTPENYERVQTDFVARRNLCKDFDKY